MSLKERLKNLPKEDYEWLAERLQPSPEAPESDIKIRLGGLFSPGYEMAYQAAWQALMPRARELAIPILYLQRHTFELTMKDTIRMLLHTREEMRRDYEVFGTEADAKALDMKDWAEDWKLVHRKHDFDPLFDCLSKNLTILGLPEMPVDFHKVRDLIHELDPGDGSLFRYDTVRDTASEPA